MNLLFDIKLNSGEIIKGCYFIKYIRPIYGSNINIIYDYIDDSIKCYNRNGNEIKNIDLNNMIILDVYDEKTNKSCMKEFADNMTLLNHCFQGNLSGFDLILRKTKILKEC